jgi:acyl-CoA hydrolase
MPDKLVTDSLSEQIHILRYEDINGNNRLFGGKLVSWIDEVACITAMRHCGTNVTTASIDQLQFRAPAYLNDIVSVTGKLTYIGRTSMEVLVESYIEYEGVKVQLINRAYLTVVSIDSNNQPVPVKFGLTFVSDEEKHEHDQALKRVELRKQRRKEGF